MLGLICCRPHNLSLQVLCIFLLLEKLAGKLPRSTIARETQMIPMQCDMHSDSCVHRERMGGVGNGF